MEILFVVSLETQSRVAVLCCVAGAVVQAVLARLRPKTAMQAGYHLLVCETFCWSGLNSFPTKRMKRQRSSSSLAGLGRDLALNGSFGRVREERRSPEWRAERVAVSVEPVSQSRASRLCRYSTGGLARRQHRRGSLISELSFPAGGADSAGWPHSIQSQIWLGELTPVVPCNTIWHTLLVAGCWQDAGKMR